MGYEYSCESATCYCLYNDGTLSNKYSRCFDSINTNDRGYTSDGTVSTITDTDRTCYRLHTQTQSVTTFPVESPVERPGSSICTRSPDYDCYKSGRPACCDSDYNCPSFMTMCDNVSSGVGGHSVCTWSPDYGCWPDTHGRPPCCSEDGGDFINCPPSEDVKKYQPCAQAKPTRRPTRKVSILLHITLVTQNRIYTHLLFSC